MRRITSALGRRARLCWSASESQTGRRGIIVVDAVDVQEAFRRGITGAAFADAAALDGSAQHAPFVYGGGEAILLAVRRLPGLSDPRAAYETGRALRMIVRLFDQAGAPEIVGRQFIDNLAGAVVVEHMRYPSRPWGAADTVDMFVEMYTRVLGGPRSEHELIRRAVMDYAVGSGEFGPARSVGGLGGVFRRRRALNGNG
jgi:hypothetical protein